MKRILTIQDISCIGKCSLTVALPVISAMGVEAAILPTAVLSTHTAFPGFTFHDLTAEMEPITAHWQAQGLGFDGIYTGYLGSFEQIHLVRRIIEQFRAPGQFVLVDPAMGDNGALYTGFDAAFAREMAGLVAVSDLCMPNLTEACAMLDLPYQASGDEAFYRRLLEGLCGLGAKYAVLTGVSLQPGRLGVMGMAQRDGAVFHYDMPRLPAACHGTGDIFASVCAGAMARGIALPEALRLAHDFTAESIRRTLADPAHRWYGVNFEEAMPFLLARLQSLTSCEGGPAPDAGAATAP